jgi:hypothetical protein
MELCAFTVFVKSDHENIFGSYSRSLILKICCRISADASRFIEGENLVVGFDVRLRVPRIHPAVDKRLAITDDLNEWGMPCESIGNECADLGGVIRTPCASPGFKPIDKLSSRQGRLLVVHPVGFSLQPAAALGPLRRVSGEVVEHGDGLLVGWDLCVELIEDGRCRTCSRTEPAASRPRGKVPSIPSPVATGTPAAARIRTPRA